MATPPASRKPRGPKPPRPSPTAEPASRARGRPRGDAPDQRIRLLDAALASYVRHGIAATTLRHVASDAGVTPALVHYYFADAGGLREAVIAERLMPVFVEIRDTVLGAPDAALRDVLVAFIDALCAQVARHPWLPPLWIREVVSEGGSLRALLVHDLAPQMAGVLAARFAQEQAAGRLNAALDPRLLLVSLVGLTLFPASGTSIWRQIFDSDGLGIVDIRNHALALLERGLELPA